MENKKSLFVGFKGKKNSSGLLVTELSKSLSLSDKSGLNSFCLLTNSFDGVKRGIDSILEKYEQVIMFGCDKSLKSCVRIERFAERNGIKLETNLNLELLSRRLGEGGIENVISETSHIIYVTKPTGTPCKSLKGKQFSFTSRHLKILMKVLFQK